MKRILFLGLIALIAGASSISAQTIIENPATPASKSAGRTIALKEMLKVTDESGEFFFKSPRLAAEDHAGSFYVLDDEQILVFDKNLKFVRNLFKKGQGPGEMAYALALFITPLGICVQAGGPEKLVWFDFDGKRLKDLTIRRKERISLRLAGVLQDRYLFAGNEFPRPEKPGAQYVDAAQSLLFWGGGDDPPKRIAEFPARVFLVPSSSGGGGMISIAPFFVAPLSQKTVAVVHTSEYSLKFFDLDSNTVRLTFSRTYERIKSPPPTEEAKKPIMWIDGKTFSSPLQENMNDITKVITRGDRILAVTSTRDPKKGTLIDVFDAAGKYVDSFYMKIPSNNYAVFGDLLYSTEKNPDETIVLKKYRIEWKD